MKKISLFFVLLFIFGTASVYADFSSNTAVNSGTKTFTKPSWASSLNVYENYVINPFKSSTIVRNTTCVNGNCRLSNYTVNGRVFNSSHPLYKSFGERRKNWSEVSDGISTYIQYRENTYTFESGIPKPNQSVTLRKYYAVHYKHDTTTPTCGEVKYYNDINLTRPFTYNGGWLNNEKYYTMICKDSQTGCYCAPDDSNCIVSWGKVVSTPQLLGHNIRPSVSFTNSVNLTDTSCQPGGSFRRVLYDLKTPKLEMSYGSEDLEVNIETNRLYKEASGKKLDGVETPGRLDFSLVTGLNRKVGETDISFDVEDIYLASSVHGVSGMKDYEFSVIRHTDRSFQNLSTPEDISTCKITKSFPEYNPSGSISVTDSHSESLTCNELLKTGRYSLVLSANDWAGNSSILTVPLNVYPEDLDIANSSVTTPDSRDKFANNSDIYTYEVTLRDRYMNPLFNRRIDTIEQSIQSYTLGKGIQTQDGDNALEINRLTNNTDNQGKIFFELSALKPGEYTQRFRLNLRTWGDDYLQNDPAQNIYLLNITDNEFLKPFTANISVIWPGSAPELWTLQEYRIDLNNIGGISSLSNGSLAINDSTLTFDTPHNFDALLSIDNTFNLSDLVCWFEGSINAVSGGAVLSGAVLAPKNLPITYTIWGEQVRYTLDEFSVAGCDKTTLGLKVLWNLQWSWKGNITGQKDNFSDLSQYSLRTDIQKNVVNLVKGLNSGDIVNGVRYVEGDATIWGEITTYETLVVRNGNVFISSDLNTAKRKLWIIVLKDDGYDVRSDYNTVWNIYIWKDVENVYASMYADGTLRSAKTNGDEYMDAEIYKKLYIFGGIFTKNTIWWAVAAGSDLLLPGGNITSDVDLAKIYDLNYLRKSNICGTEYSTLIEFDPNIQLNPPKGFGK